jgi:hypothetical protein
MEEASLLATHRASSMELMADAEEEVLIMAFLVV